MADFGLYKRSNLPLNSVSRLQGTGATFALDFKVDGVVHYGFVRCDDDARGTLYHCAVRSLEPPRVWVSEDPYRCMLVCSGYEWHSVMYLGDIPLEKFKKCSSYTQRVMYSLNPKDPSLCSIYTKLMVADLSGDNICEQFFVSHSGN